MISTGTPCRPEGKAVAERPSADALAPVPPAVGATVAQGRPSARRPPVLIVQMLAAPSAIDGITPCNALKTAPGTKWPSTCRPATGAGQRAFRMQPSGAVTRSGRKAPALLGMSGLTRHFSA